MTKPTAISVRLTADEKSRLRALLKRERAAGRIPKGTTFADFVQACLTVAARERGDRQLWVRVARAGFPRPARATP